jgi:hypothetical protein
VRSQRCCAATAQWCCQVATGRDLREAAARHLPPAYRALVAATREPFLQTIQDLSVRRMAVGRIAYSQSKRDPRTRKARRMHVFRGLCQINVRTKGCRLVRGYDRSSRPARTGRTRGAPAGSQRQPRQIDCAHGDRHANRRRDAQPSCRQRGTHSVRSHDC